MKNEMQLFENQEFGEIRTIEINGEGWFVGNDIAKALGYKNPRDAIIRNVDSEDVAVADTLTNGGTQAVKVINESGMYALVILSELPTAKKFKHWITSEVLPSIRKHGGYISGQSEMSPEELLSKALTYVNSKSEEQARQLVEKDIEIFRLKPMAELGEAITYDSGCISVANLSMVLNENGYETGEYRLYNDLREDGFVIDNKGKKWNLPTDLSLCNGLLEIGLIEYKLPNGQTGYYKKTIVTKKGKEFFVNKYCNLK